MASTTEVAARAAALAEARDVQRHTIYLIGRERVGVVPLDQAMLMLTLAEDLESHRDTMTKQTDRLATLLAFAGRLREAMQIATSSSVRVEVDPAEEGIAEFLLVQARSRVAMMPRTRYKHECTVCGKTSLSNPEYEKLVDHKRRVDAATRGLGVVFQSGMGLPISPVIMVNSLMALRKQPHEYPCRSCYAVETEESVVVFCPQCQGLYDRALLKRCGRCGYDFTAAVDLSDLWHAPETVEAPPPPGAKLSELQLSDTVSLIRVLPDAARMLTATHDGSVRMWDISDFSSGPRPMWRLDLGGAWVRSPAVTLSPDAQWVAAGRPGDSLVHVLRTTDGSKVRTVSLPYDDGGTRSLSFTHDGQDLVVASACNVGLWGPTGTLLHHFKMGALSAPELVSCSTDGDYLVAAGGSVSAKHLWVWDLRNRTLMGKHSLGGRITDLAWDPSPDRPHHLAVATGNKAAMYWMPENKLHAVFTLDAEVTAVAFSYGGEYLAVSSRDQSARVFQVNAPRAEIARISRPVEVTAIAFGPDGRLAVGDESNLVEFWAPPLTAAAT